MPWMCVYVSFGDNFSKQRDKIKDQKMSIKEWALRKNDVLNSIFYFYSTKPTLSIPMLMNIITAIKNILWLFKLNLPTTQLKFFHPEDDYPINFFLNLC